MAMNDGKLMFDDEYDEEFEQKNKKPKTKLEIQWESFHIKHPQVYELIKVFAYEAINAGYKNYSINAIFERVRWHATIETPSLDFNLSNNHRAYYSRLFLKDHPQHPKFFKTKLLRSKL